VYTQTAQYLTRINLQFVYFTYYHGINSLPIPQIWLLGYVLTLFTTIHPSFGPCSKLIHNRYPINRGPKIGHVKFYHCILVVLHTHSLRKHMWYSISWLWATWSQYIKITDCHTDVRDHISTSSMSASRLTITLHTSNILQPANNPLNSVVVGRSEFSEYKLTCLGEIQNKLNHKIHLKLEFGETKLWKDDGVSCGFRFNSIHNQMQNLDQSVQPRCFIFRH